VAGASNILSFHKSQSWRKPLLVLLLSSVLLSIPLLTLSVVLDGGTGFLKVGYAAQVSSLNLQHHHEYGADNAS
jgi:hypothetical protein